jgi:hypothetical protein
MKTSQNILLASFFLAATMLWCDFIFGDNSKTTVPNSMSCQGNETTCRQRMQTALKDSEGIWNKLVLKHYTCQVKTLVSFEDLHPPRVKFANVEVKNGKITKTEYFDQKNQHIKPRKQDRIPSIHTVDDIYKKCQKEFFNEFEPIDQYLGYITFNSDGILEACGYANQSDLSLSYECVLIK